VAASKGQAHKALKNLQALYTRSKREKVAWRGEECVPSLPLARRNCRNYNQMTKSKNLNIIKVIKPKRTVELMNGEMRKVSLYL
jgi:hypothetical protein